MQLKLTFSGFVPAVVRTESGKYVRVAVTGWRIFFCVPNWTTNRSEGTNSIWFRGKQERRNSGTNGQSKPEIFLDVFNLKRKEAILWLEDDRVRKEFYWTEIGLMCTSGERLFRDKDKRWMEMPSRRVCTGTGQVQKRFVWNISTSRGRNSRAHTTVVRWPRT